MSRFVQNCVCNFMVIAKSDNQKLVIFMKTELFFGLTVFASLFFVLDNFAFAESSGNYHAIAYNQVDDAVSLHDYIQNPSQKMASATIKFVFEDIDSGNEFSDKVHTGLVDGNSKFIADQAYFMRNPGQFLIHTEYEINGQPHKDTQIKKFVIVDDLSGKALSGCNTAHKIIVRPDYSSAVCVSEATSSKLMERGWVGHDPNSIMKTASHDEMPVLAGMSLWRLSDHYKIGDQILIQGFFWFTDYKDDKGNIINDEIMPLVIQVINPNGDLVEVDQLANIREGEFSYPIDAAGPQWQKNGLYTVDISYGGKTIEKITFGFTVNPDEFPLSDYLQPESNDYESLCGFPVTDEMRMQAIHDNSHRFTREGIPYFDLYSVTFTHIEHAPNYPANDPHLVYWFDFDNRDKQIGFKIGACDVDGSNMSMVERRN